MKLPIVIQSDVVTYLCDALPLCIIQAYPNIKNWFLSHYIEIFAAYKFNEKSCNNLQLFYMESGTYMDRHRTSEVLEYNHIYSKPIMDNIGIIDYLKECISSGFYAIVFFNEIFLQGKKAYEKYDFIHETLIYGFDDEKQIISGISFNSSQTFASFEISYLDCNKAFQSTIEKSDELVIWRYIHLIKPINADFAFNFDHFKHQLTNYLKSKIDSIDKYNLFAFDRKSSEDNLNINHVFGLDVYDKIIDLYRQGISLDINSQYMNMHLMYEQKKNIYRSLQYINENMICTSVLKDLVDSYRFVVEEHNIVRMAMLKMYYNKRLDGTKVIFVNKIIPDRLESIKQNEQDILLEVIKLF